MAQAASKWHPEEEANFDSVKPDSETSQSRRPSEAKPKDSVTPIDRAWPGKSEPGHIRPIGPARRTGESAQAGAEADEMHRK